MPTRLVIAALLVLAGLAPTASADHSTFIVAFDSSTAYGDLVTLKAQLLEPEDDCFGRACPVVGRQVDFYVDGAYVGTDVTNSGGFAYLLIESAQAWHPGTHEIRAQYDRFVVPSRPAVALAKLTIAPEATLLAAHDGYLEAQLTDDDNVPLVGFAVRFSKPTAAGDHEICTAFTDATGTARCVAATGAGVTPLDHAASEYRATFAGTGDYVRAVDAAVLV